jgi:hypothetical protein
MSELEPGVSAPSRRSARRARDVRIGALVLAALTIAGQWRALAAGFCLDDVYVLPNLASDSWARRLFGTSVSPSGVFTPGVAVTPANLDAPPNDIENVVTGSRVFMTPDM